MPNLFFLKIQLFLNRLSIMSAHANRISGQG